MVSSKTPRSPNGYIDRMFFCLSVLYVIILSAALDLVPPSTPKGIILFCNIFPSLIAKLGWPYILKGRIRYARRLYGCCLLSVTGMIVSSYRSNLRFSYPPAHSI